MSIKEMNFKYTSDHLNEMKERLSQINIDLSPKAFNEFWDNKMGSSTRCLISICIKENVNQTLEQLAKRVAKSRHSSISWVKERLVEMYEAGTLGYWITRLNKLDAYPDYAYVKWIPGEYR